MRVVAYDKRHTRRVIKVQKTLKITIEGLDGQFTPQLLGDLCCALKAHVSFDLSLSTFRLSSTRHGDDSVVEVSFTPEHEVVSSTEVATQEIEPEAATEVEVTSEPEQCAELIPPPPEVEPTAFTQIYSWHLGYLSIQEADVNECMLHAPIVHADAESVVIQVGEMTHTLLSQYPGAGDVVVRLALQAQGPADSQVSSNTQTISQEFRVINAENVLLVVPRGWIYNALSQVTEV